MNNENIDKQKLMEALLSSSGGKIDKNSVNSAVNGKNIAPLVNSLSSEDREKLNAAMSDKKSLEKALKSPQDRKSVGRERVF